MTLTAIYGKRRLRFLYLFFIFVLYPYENTRAAKKSNFLSKRKIENQTYLSGSVCRPSAVTRYTCGRGRGVTIVLFEP